MRGKGIQVFRYNPVPHDHPSHHSYNQVGLRGPTFINFNLKPLLPTYLPTHSSSCKLALSRSVRG